MKRDPAGARELLGERELVSGLGTQAVVYSAGKKPKPRRRVRAFPACGVRNVREDVEQHLRVDASRARHQDRAAIRDVGVVERATRERCQ